jgi:hypothetical protein
VYTKGWAICKESASRHFADPEAMPRLKPPLQAALERADSPHLVVVRSGGLGDTLLTLPVLRVLLEACPGGSLTFVGSQWAERLWPLLALPCRLLRFDGPELTPLFAPDAATDPTGAFANATAAIVFSASPRDALALNVRRLCPGPVALGSVEPGGGMHAARHFLSTVCADPPAPLPLPPLRTSPEGLEWARRWLGERFGHTRAPLAVHPGSGGRRKCWPAECFAAVAASLERPVLLVEGPADHEAAARARDRLPAGLPVAAASHMPLPDLAALLSCCHALLGNDSGISHLAGILGVHTVAVFGATDPAVWSPLGPSVRTAGSPGKWPEPSDVAGVLRGA